MKSLVRSLITAIIFLCAETVAGQDLIQDQAPFQGPEFSTYGSLDYWMSKISDQKINYVELNNEFERYWAGKEPVKGSGYKQVKRWLIHQEAYLNQDGSLRLPQEDHEAALTYNQQYASQSITGEWTYAGPQNPVCGRTTAIGFDPHNPERIYVGTPLGGLWRSNDSGANWFNMHTDAISTLGVSAISVHPNDPDIIFIGTGDRDSEDTRGIGIYKSVDGGFTWIPKPISGYHDKVVHKIYFHPDDPNIMIIASNYGIYKSLDGGDSWERILHAYLKDAEQKPSDPLTIYAVNGNSFYKSTDFGSTWDCKLSGIAHRIAIGVTAANPNKVVLFTSRNSEFHQLYVSNNSGESFTLVNNPTGLANEQQGGYNLDIIIDPLNENIMYAGMVNFYKSTNGGATWVNQQIIVADDQHTFEFHPVTHRLFIGNDSGIWLSDDGQNYWWSGNGLNIAEIYRMDVAAQNPDHLIIGSQDASTHVSNGGTWFNSVGGDGITCKFDYSNSNYVYGSSQYRHIARSTTGGLSSSSFQSIAGENINGINQSGNFQTAFLIDYFNPSIMYAGMKDLWGSTNIKTTDPADVQWLRLSNGEFGANATIEFIEQSKANPNVIYIFTDDSRIFRTLNAYASNPSWSQLVNPTNSRGVRFESHPTNPNIVYMTCGTKVYKSEHQGVSWVEISETSPNIGLLSIAYMNGSPEGLYIGTTAGVYYKDTTMAEWVPFKTGIPLTQVRDIVINYSTVPAQLYAATHGRGIWKTTVLPVYKPDLITSSGAATVNGTVVNCYNGIFNSESMVTVGQNTAGYYLSPDDAFNTSDYLLGTETIQSISPGFLIQVQLPLMDVALIHPEIPVGSYYIGMLVDHLNEIDESNEANNQWVSPNMVTIPANPVPPANVQATDGIYLDKTTITWQNNTGETLFYSVYRSQFASPVLAQRISPEVWLSGTSFEDFTATNGITYYYWVKASRYAGGDRESDFSSSNTGWKALSPPENVLASDGQFSDRITISWLPLSGANYYRVFRSTTPDGIVSNISGVTWISNTVFSDYNVISGTTYYYFVKAAKDEFGSHSSDFSEYDSGWNAFGTAPDAQATDGLYTDRIEITWNSIAGATHYKLYRSTVASPEFLIPVTSWQTALSYSDYLVNPGVFYMYWVKGSQDAIGTIVTGFGESDSGIRNVLPPAFVDATDGSSTEFTGITWQASTGASWYKVYRGTTSSTTTAIPISNWQNELFLSDSLAVPGRSLFYSVKAAADTTVCISAYSDRNSGYRNIKAPEVNATIGIYPEKVVITWDDCEGASYYLVQRSPANEPGNLTLLTNWSNSLNFQFEDITAIQGEYYTYYITGSRTSTGTLPGLTGNTTGLADACSNLTEDPSFRSINFHSTTLEFSTRIVNEGPHPMLNPGVVAFALEDSSPDGTPEVMIGYIDIPALEAGNYFDLTYSVDLAAISGFDFTYGTWHLACFTSWDNTNCDSNPDDDYLIWQSPSFNYTNALHGVYTINRTTGDFLTPAEAVGALLERGISDPVFFHIEPGQYFEKLILGSISGTGPDKWVTFLTDPAFGDTAELRGNPNHDENFTIRFENCAYVLFQNLKLSTSGYSDFQSTYGHVIEIGQGCHDLKFRFNRIEGNTDDSHIYSDNDVIFSENVSSSNILFEGNGIFYGVTAINMSGSDFTTGNIINLEIKGNRIERFMRSGINLRYLDHPEISSNTIITDNTTVSDHSAIECFFFKNGYQICGNKISLNTQGRVNRGILLQDINMDELNPGLIANNFISLSGATLGVYGLQTYNINSTAIVNNSINLFGTPGQFSTALLVGCSADPITYDNIMINNNIRNMIDGYCITYSEYAITRALFTDFDYNNYDYSGQNIAFLEENNIANLEAWNTATGFDSNSVNIDPEYFSDTDLHSNSQALDNRGIPFAEVVVDIDNEPRSTLTPDIGADEYTYTADFKTLNLTIFFEGLYNGTNTMRQAIDENGPHFGAGIADQIIVELHDAVNYSNIVYTSPQVNIATNGQVVLSAPAILNGTYYITIRHRNSIETTTSVPVSFTSGVIDYNFDAPAKAYGGNLLQMITGQYVIFGGDVNQDGFVDTGDMTPVDNGSANFETGYLSTDVNGDGFVDTADMTIIDNNSAGFVGAVTP